FAARAIRHTRPRGGLIAIVAGRDLHISPAVRGTESGRFRLRHDFATQGKRPMTPDYASPYPLSLSSVSWGAVIAGGIVAAAISLFLLAFGSGVGFLVVSPWADRGISASTFAWSAAI